jgi:hypothetical protein
METLTTELEEILYRRASDHARAAAHALVEDGRRRRQLADELRHRFDLHGKRLGELLPGLADAVEPQPPFREVSVRLRNVLRRAGISTWERLASSTVTELSELPNSGVKSVTEVLVVAILGWAELSWLTDANGRVATDAVVEENGARAPTADAHERDAGSVDPPKPSPMADLMIEAGDLLRRVWEETGAETLEEAIDDLAAFRVHGASGLGRLRLDQLLGMPAVDESSWESLLAMPYRERRIMELRTRRPAGQRETLDQLGRRFNLTRERIRQLEGRVHEALETRIAGPEGLAFRHLARRVMREIGDVSDPAAVDQLLTLAVANTSHDGNGELELRKAVLRDLAGPLIEIGGLLWSARGRERLEDLERHYSSAAPGDALEERPLAAAMNELGGNADIRDRILDHLGLRACNGSLVVWRGSMADLAVSCLAAHARPMSIDEIHGELGYDRNPRSLAGRVQTDPRIIRLGRDSYGLREWGGEEYAGILDGIERAIAEAGGAVDGGDLVVRLAARFGVSENSVRAYAKDRRFIRRADGTIALRTAEDPEVPIGARPIELARGVVRLDGVWHLRVVVDPEVLRGSGRPMARSVALEAGIEPDLTLGFEYDGGTVLFSWGAIQPSLGSVRGVALAHSCVESDLLFLPLDGPEPRPVRVVRSAGPNAEHGARRLAIELGLDPASVSDDDPVVIAIALGLPAGAEWEDVRERLADRGEADLTMHVPAAWE